MNDISLQKNAKENLATNKKLNSAFSAKTFSDVKPIFA